MSKILKNLWLEITQTRKKYFVLEFPYPYTRMLAINSDVEWTSWEAQLKLIQQFTELGLECSYSYWFYTGGDKTWSMFSHPGSKAHCFNKAAELAKSGILDAIHGFGGKRHIGGVQFNRQDVLDGYELLENAGIQTKIFSNHGSEYDTQNIGGDWGSYQLGDVPGACDYHLDRTLQHGVRYFWTDIDYVVDKVFLSATINRDDSLFRLQNCRDGNRIICFRRFLGKLSQGPSADNLEEQLNQVLECKKKGYAVIYQHLGVHRDEEGKPHSAIEPVFSVECLEYMKRLAEKYHSGEILVTSTIKLLNHALMMTVKPWVINCGEGYLEVNFKKRSELDGIQLSFNETELSGWAVQVPKDWDVKIHYGRREIITGRIENKSCSVVYIPWDKKNIIPAEF